MTPQPFDAADVPALRRDLLDWIRDGRGLNFHASMSFSAGTMIGRPELDGDPAMMRAYAEMLVEQETRTLADAELYYVTAEMTTLVQAAAVSMPAFPPNAGDFPAPSGLIVYETPLVHYDRAERIDAIVVGGRLALDRHGETREEIGITACTWGPYNAGGNWPRGGVWMSFYRDRREMLANVVDEGLREELRPGLARLVPDNEYGIKYEDDPDRRAALEQGLHATDQPAYTSYWAKHLMATLLLMRQPLVYQRTEPVRRGLRRQLERAGYPAGDIRILDARPRRYTAVPRVDDGEEMPESAAAEARTIGVRFPVRGFWRNQWYPSRGVHRPRWIDPHWRGPEDGPIVHAERVRVLRSHEKSPIKGDS